MNGGEISMRRTLGTLFGLVLALGLVGTGWSATAPTTSSTTKPATSTTTKPAKVPFGPKTHPSKAEKLGSQVININTASSADLQKVPGIGKATADKIVKGRPFTNVDDLVTKKIMKKKDLDKVRGNLSTR
jgi:competence protein ComEA